MSRTVQFAKTTTAALSTPQVNEQQSPDAPTPEQVLLDSMTREWLRIHGAPLPVGKLTAQQAHEIRDCFDLLDEDGSGALTVDEFQRAFKMLGMKVSNKAVDAMMASVDIDKTGEIEFDEFRTLMAHSMTQEGPGSSTIAQGTDLPFEEVVRAGRRRKMLQDVCKGGATRKRVVQEYADLLAACEVDNPLASQASLMNSVLAGKAHAAAAESTVTQVVKVRRNSNYYNKAQQSSAAQSGQTTARSEALAPATPSNNWALAMEAAAEDSVQWGTTSTESSQAPLTFRPKGSSTRQDGEAAAGPSGSHLGPHFSFPQLDHRPESSDITALLHASSSLQSHGEAASSHTPSTLARSLSPRSARLMAAVLAAAGDDELIQVVARAHSSKAVPPLAHTLRHRLQEPFGAEGEAQAAAGNAKDPRQRGRQSTSAGVIQPPQYRVHTMQERMAAVASNHRPAAVYS